MVPWFLKSSGNCRSSKAQDTWPQREGETHGPQTPEEQEVFFKGGGRARAIYTTEMSVPGPTTRKFKKRTTENRRQPFSQQGIKTGSRKMEPISPTFLQDTRQKATSIAVRQQLTHAPRAQGKRSDPQKLLSESQVRQSLKDHENPTKQVWSLQFCLFVCFWSLQFYRWGKWCCSQDPSLFMTRLDDEHRLRGASSPGRALHRFRDCTWIVKGMSFSVRLTLPLNSTAHLLVTIISQLLTEWKTCVKSQHDLLGPALYREQVLLSLEVCKILVRTSSLLRSFIHSDSIKHSLSRFLGWAQW